MLQYIIRRLLLAIPILIAVVTLVFFVVRMAPGDPAQVMLGDSASQESLESLRGELGLDRPFLYSTGSFCFPSSGEILAFYHTKAVHQFHRRRGNALYN
jgi:ABC-type dipeptide/oligopeptide/nickel transport system permease component